jgi:hypothetical protein
MYLALGFCIAPVAASNNFGSGAAYLFQGQTHIYTVTADSSSQIIMTPPIGTNFDLFAMQCQTSRCSCPTASYVMQFATYASRNGAGMQQSVTLPRGTWCVVVFAQSGSGAYTISENFRSFQMSMPAVSSVNPMFSPPGSGQQQGIWFANGGQGWTSVHPLFSPSGSGEVQGVWFANGGQGWTSVHPLFSPSGLGEVQGIWYANGGQVAPSYAIDI